MLAVQLALMLANVAEGVSTAARIWDFSIASTAGNKNTGVAATISLNWQSEDLTSEVIKVYQDNILVATLTAADTTWSKTIDGYAEADLDDFTAERTTLGWRYRVELRSSADALIATLENTWSMVYERAGLVT